MSCDVLVLQHHSISGPGTLGQALTAAGLRMCVREVESIGAAEWGTLLDGHRALVVLGGPQDAYRDEGFATRQAELALLRQALQRDVPVLGICLGGQLLAIAAGGAGYRAPSSENGWHWISLTPEGLTDPVLSALGGDAVMMESHNDSVELPDAATLLAVSDCYRQAWRVGACAWGVQFHPEAAEDFAAARLALFDHWRPTEHALAPTASRAQLSAQQSARLFAAWAQVVHARAPRPAQVSLVRGRDAAHAASHDWYVQDAPQGQWPQIRCRRCPAHKPYSSGPMRGLPVPPGWDAPCPGSAGA